MPLPNLPDLEVIKKEIENEFRAYCDAIELLSSLRDFFHSKSIPCHIEKTVDKKDGGYKQPDLIVCSDNYLFIDHKYTKSQCERNLEEKISAVNEYDTIYIFEDEKRNKIEIQPECVMLTPKDVIKSIRKKSNCPVTWGYKLDGSVWVEQSIGSVKDSKVSSFFNPVMVISLSSESTKYRFVLSHAPKAYTTFQVYSILWILYQPKDYYKTTFQITYRQILSDFNNMFSPWVLKEAHQLNPTRLKEALTFLSKLGWLELIDSPSGKVVLVNRKKGLKMGDLIPFFKAQHAQQEYERQMRKYKALLAKKGLSYLNSEQSKLTRFLNSDNF